MAKGSIFVLPHTPFICVAFFFVTIYAGILRTQLPMVP